MNVQIGAKETKKIGQCAGLYNFPSSNRLFFPRKGTYNTSVVAAPTSLGPTFTCMHIVFAPTFIILDAIFAPLYVSIASKKKFILFYLVKSI